MKRRCLKRIALLVLSVVWICGCSVFAEEASEEDCVNIIVPDSLRDYLPDNFENFRAADVMDQFDFGFFAKIGMQILTETAPEAAKVFADRKIKLFGNESQTVGPEDAPMEVHLIMLGAEIVLLEGIRLSDVEEGVYILHAAPLNLGGAEGAPCRATLISPDL